MSDHWNYFPCQMGDHAASIFYDHGIRESIDAVAQSHLLKVRAALEKPRADGMPTREEFGRLTALEDELQGLIERRGGLYVGRVTVDRHRHFYFYVPDPNDDWAEPLESLGTRHGYPLAYSCELDSEHEGYWNELYPTEDDWQVIKDLGVLEALRREGDDGTASRRVDHWAYFNARPVAERFSEWAKESGYTVDGCEDVEDAGICVRFAHEGAVTLGEISSHTIALRRKASELGGKYDGWETPVCKPASG